jgi:hypothetical protein
MCCLCCLAVMGPAVPKRVGWVSAHLHNAVHEGVKALPHEAQGGDRVQHVLQEACRRGVGVRPAERDVVRCVQAAVHVLAGCSGGSHQPAQWRRQGWRCVVRVSRRKHARCFTWSRDITVMDTSCEAMHASVLTYTKRRLHTRAVQVDPRAKSTQVATGAYVASATSAKMKALAYRRMWMPCAT